jgi:hypothetical protein
MRLRDVKRGPRGAKGPSQKKKTTFSKKNSQTP